mgnify:CR=1 FL=1
MYSQDLFRTDSQRDLLALMRAHPLATLVARTEASMEAHLLPLQVPDDDEAPLRLRGHLSRQHALAGLAEGAEVLGVFQSPNAYISPRWYVNGQRSGRNAPSWNYAAAEVRGRIRFVDDQDWLLTHLDALTRSQEDGRDSPWSLAEAAPDFIQDTARRLLGFEIDITHMTGKRFLSQQRTSADRDNLIKHLLQEKPGAARDVAAMIVP